MLPCPRLFQTLLSRPSCEDFDIPVLAEARRRTTLGSFKSDSGAEVSFGHTEKLITMVDWTESQFLEYYTLLQAQVHNACPLDMTLLSEIHSWQMEVASVLSHVGAWSVARRYMVDRRTKFVQGTAAFPLGQLDVLLLQRQMYGSVVLAPPVPAPLVPARVPTPCINCQGSCLTLHSCKAAGNPCRILCSRCHESNHWTVDCASQSPKALAFDKNKQGRGHSGTA